MCVQAKAAGGVNNDWKLCVCCVCVCRQRQPGGRTMTGSSPTPWCMPTKDLTARLLPSRSACVSVQACLCQSVQASWTSCACAPLAYQPFLYLCVWLGVGTSTCVLRLGVGSSLLLHAFACVRAHAHTHMNTRWGRRDGREGMGEKRPFTCAHTKVCIRARAHFLYAHTCNRSWVCGAWRTRARRSAPA